MTVTIPVSTQRVGALRVEGLTVTAANHRQPLVADVSFELAPGESLGIVGESGSGKSMTCRTLLGILPRGVTATSGTVDFDGTDLTRLDYSEWMRIRGSRIAAVFQDPASYLNPSIPVGRQLAEVLRVQLGLSRKDAVSRALESLVAIGLQDVQRVYRAYTFELSGGMLQRVLIAIAIAAEPDILIADEATTALDMTVQAEVLDLIAEIRERRGLSLILVSHDLAVVAQMCERLIVMRAGRVVEAGRTADILDAPQHEYTRSLIENHERFGLEHLLAGVRE